MPVPAATLVPCPNHPEVTTGLTACAHCGRNFCSDCLVTLGGAPTCASCKADRLSELRTGGAELDLATPGTRFLAQLIDGLIFGLPFMVYMFTVAFRAGLRGQTPSTPGLFTSWVLWIPGLVYIVYEGLMLSARGQTLGKMATGIKVVTPEGGTISPGQAWLRAASRAAMNILYIAIVDVLFIFSARNRTLHDRIARTLVVRWRR